MHPSLLFLVLNLTPPTPKLVDTPFLLRFRRVPGSIFFDFLKLKGIIYSPWIKTKNVHSVL